MVRVNLPSWRDRGFLHNFVIPGFIIDQGEFDGFAGKIPGSVPVTIACCADTPIDTNSKIMSMLIVTVLFIFAFGEDKLS
jgi:hypothetical protein